MIDFSFQDKDKELKFLVQRLKPFEQFNFMLRVISIISKGASSNTAEVEQILHNVLQTGKEVEGAKQLKNDVQPIKLLLDAIKGALAQLEDKDRDWLIKELLKNVKIVDGIIKIPATIDELNTRLSGFQPVFKLLIELVKLNLGFL